MRLAVRLSSVAVLALTSFGLVEACTGDDAVLTDAGTGVDSGGRDADPEADTDAGQGGEGGQGAGDGGDAGYAPATGDIVVLGATGIDTDGTGFVTQWRNEVAGSPLKAAVTTTSSKPTKVLAGIGGTTPCVGFTQSELMQMPDAMGMLKPLGDFSVTAVLSSSQGAYAEFGQVPVARTAATDPGPQHDSYVGWALYAWFQPANRIGNNEPKFAGRLSYTLSSSALEVVATLPNVDDKIYGVAMFRRGSNLYLAVDDALYGPTAGASSSAQPDMRPLLLGKSDDDSDFGGTAFKGRLCAVVVHHGAETDGEILQRVAALRAPF
jgi:hypothetical protein